MVIFPMHRIRKWVKETNRRIEKDGHRGFCIPGVIKGFHQRPMFRRIASLAMRREGYW